MTSIQNMNTTDIAHFDIYQGGCFRATGSSAPEQIGLNFTAGRHMLRIKPEARQSDIGSLHEESSRSTCQIMSATAVTKHPHKKARQHRSQRSRRRKCIGGRDRYCRRTVHRYWWWLVDHVFSKGDPSRDPYMSPVNSQHNSPTHTLTPRRRYIP